ncbi:pyridine nucleotide-disulfide oxidoreductase [Thiocystis minor]|uniref:NAD(P)/FAD-dependent oxidoreductase n=1 Tax=Thiocystis minor TaxID=61597 RepID=UPI0019138A25|nr:FAD/NAD(P)-binding oxidoreductase [Thiocystis minor]MBK5966902.1 pyridine nucleotide-disulfide oxidoreductase [Thiocystis minor]
MSEHPQPDRSRREFLRQTASALALVLAGGGSSLAVATRPAHAVPVKNRAKIVILGAGAAGIAIANRLANRVEGAKIVIVDARRQHLYQAGLTLIASGVKSPDYVTSSTSEWLPQGVDWIDEAAVDIDPDAKTVATAGGKSIQYDFLIVATGLKLDFDAIEGFSLDLVGTNGIGAFYAGADYAERTWVAMDRFTDEGGTGIFFRPATEIKCAGAPLKYTFLTDDSACRKGSRGRVEIHYAAPSDNLFSVPIVHEKVRMLFDERGVKTHYGHVAKAIDPGRQRITFETPDGDVEMPYDFTNVVPPMRAPDVVRNSPLPWRTGKWANDGWVEVDQQTLRHVRYPNVFAIGDSAGIPTGKTASAVTRQLPVVEDHLIADIAGTRSMAIYDGYAACPLITRFGQLMMIEFDYKNNLTPSFPGVIAPLEELWASWLIQEVALKGKYRAMLHGKV